MTKNLMTLRLLPEMNCSNTAKSCPNKRKKTTTNKAARCLTNGLTTNSKSPEDFLPMRNCSNRPECN
jgi:hypothetical protein